MIECSHLDRSAVATASALETGPMHAPDVFPRSE